MKRFQFRLERVLNLRQQQTDQVKRTLAVAMAEEDLARRAMETAHAVLNARLADIRHRERQGLTAYEFGLQRNHARVLQAELAVAETGLAEAQQFTQRRRLELLTARRAERALERLRERRLEGYVAESLREEQKELDEFGDRQGLNIPSARSDI